MLTLSKYGIKRQPRKLVPAFADAWNPVGTASLRNYLATVNNLDPDRKWY